MMLNEKTSRHFVIIPCPHLVSWEVCDVVSAPIFFDHFECAKSAVEFLVCVSYHENEEVEDAHPAQLGLDQGHQVLKNRDTTKY